ncbi:MAG: rhodanese-like domain-containing protein [Actinobacteria bacterium]|nr:rhodanese-like domain-containing protein [Actinomycetota bacterium]
MNKKAIIGIFVLVLIFGGFLLFRASPQETTIATQSETAKIPKKEATSFNTLTSTQLAAMLQQKDFFFVNVHIPYEGEIKKTDAFIPYDKIVDNLDKLPTDKNAKIVLYCRSGRMSEIAARALTELGYTQVSHLSGGMIDWEKNGYEVSLA